MGKRRPGREMGAVQGHVDLGTLKSVLFSLLLPVPLASASQLEKHEGPREREAEDSVPVLGEGQ